MTHHEARLAADHRAARQFAANANHLTWAEAVTIADAVARAEHAHGRLEGRRVLGEFCAHGRLAPESLRRHVRAVQWLRAQGLEDFASRAVLAIGVVTLIVLNRNIADDVKKRLLEDLVAKVTEDPTAVVDRARVKQKILGCGAQPLEPWLRTTDDWRFESFDGRFGCAGTLDRLPGQAVQNLFELYLPAGGSVLSAGAGSGTVLDVSSTTPKVGSYFGFDITFDPEVARRHPGRYVQLDATCADLASACPGAPFDMVIVTMPQFRFGRSGTTKLRTDVGNLVDPDEFLAAMTVVIHNAASVLVVGGVLAVAVRNASDFGESPVPNLHHRIVQVVEDMTDLFLACPAITVARRRRRTAPATWGSVP